MLKAGRARVESEMARRPQLRFPGWKLLHLQDLDDPIDDRRNGLVVETSGSIKNQVDTGRKEPVWPDIARFVECSLCKVEFSNTDGVAIPDLLTRESRT